MSASVIARSDTPPVLEFGEHIFDLVTLLVEGGVVGYGNRMEAKLSDVRGYARLKERYKKQTSKEPETDSSLSRFLDNMDD